jgi:osmoprotectant transport system permease protein
VIRVPAVAALALAALLAFPDGARAAEARPPLRIGSKRFTESLILGEIAAAVARAAGDAEVTHQEGLGGTAVVYRALEEGSIDVYPDYTGTIAEAVLHDTGRPSLAAIRAALAPHGILVGDPLGFDNTYALAVPAALARSRHLARTSDLLGAPDLRYGLSPEFLARSDGWPGLVARYGLHPNNVQGIDHGLAYEAIKGGSIDVTDAYSTDAKIGRYDLTVLADDRRFFPSYEAVFLYREDAAKRSPRAFAAIGALAGRIDAPTMIALNAKAEIDHRTFAGVAQEAVASLGVSVPGGPAASQERRGLLSGILATIRAEGPRHLALTFGALALSILVGLPLGILASRGRFLGRAILGAAGILQTIPSLALLCFFIPLLGTGPVPALCALFLYGLLPIARSTAAGIEAIPSSLLDSAEALGLSPRATLFSVKLPLASRAILAGIKTCAVINVGTATLAAFIGAGGFGAPISMGLTLNDTTLILQGAIPSAGVALLAEGLFALLDKAVIPKGLRLAKSQENTSRSSGD